MILCLLLLAAFHPNSALKASCTMRLHGDGTEIGKVVFTSEGNRQSIRANLKGDPEIITEGYHGFHIHEKPVQGNNCGPESTGGHYNPDGNTHGSLFPFSDSRHVGDFGNVRAGERGEVNFYTKINVDPTRDIGMSMIGRPAIHCGPYMEKIWSDGRREIIYVFDEEIEVEKRGKKKGRKGKRKKCSKKKAKKGKCKIEPGPEEPTFTIVHHDPDCYVPMNENIDMTLHTRRFELEGEKSVVGRAVVLHAGKDDLGQGGDEGSRKTGNAGPRIACCTLELEE